MSKRSPLIRQGLPTDHEMLAALAARTFSDAFTIDNRPEDIAAYVAQAFTPQQMLTELTQPESVILLACDAATPAAPALGYARLVTNSDHPHLQGQQSLELNRLYVEQEAIGRGYGAALMTASLEVAIAHHCDTLWLGVWEHNTRAQKFYERWGFKPVSTQTFVLGEEVQTDWVMARPVNLPDEAL
ncbi:MAG: GNAT family N-acetyltransferase, partial [Leptolyngbya sp. RL_3_1]|nr:GNAT family N-acetyltransferase [Leptolyngbya sp. RL_3_1]